MKAYLSHTIRGRSGSNATEEEMAANCAAALRIGQKIRELLPKLDLHVPAEHEEFVGRAFREGLLDEKAILHIDCEIINSGDLLFVYVVDGWVGGGIGVEIRSAQTCKTPVIFIFGEEKIDNAVDIATSYYLR